MLKCLLFINLPTERSSKTNEYLNPTLRFLEAHYISDAIESLDKGGLYKKAIFLAYLQFLILRAKFFYNRFKTANLNRSSYKKLNVVQLDWAYIGALRSTLRGWIDFCIGARNHKCCSDSTLHTRQGLIMKGLSEKLKHLTKIDRLYYFNQIDFNQCFQGASLTCIKSNESKYQIYYAKRRRMQKNNSQGSDSENGIDKRESNQLTSVRESKTFVESIKSLMVPDRRTFMAEPLHRVDPVHLYYLILMTIIGSSLGLILVTTLFLAHIYDLLIKAGLNPSDLVSTIRPATGKFLDDSKPIFGVLCDHLTNILLCLNICDNGLLAYSTVLCHSRAGKVLRMLKHELLFYHYHVQATRLEYQTFVEPSNQMISNSHSLLNIQSMPLLGGEEEENDDDDCIYLDDVMWINCEHSPLDRAKFSPKLFHRPTGTNIMENTEQKTRDRNYLFDLRQPRPSKFENKLEIEITWNNIDTIVQFEPNTNEKPIDVSRELTLSRIETFNDNIRYIIDLIGILQNELNDLKMFFTLYLNLNIIFGTAGSIITFTILANSRGFHQGLMAVSVSMVTIAPLVFALFIGATSEKAVCIKSMFSKEINLDKK